MGVFEQDAADVEQPIQTPDSRESVRDGDDKNQGRRGCWAKTRGPNNSTSLPQKKKLTQY